MFPAFVKLIDRQKAYQESSSSGVLDVPETLGDGVGRVEASLGMFLASLKMIGWQKACQDSSCPPSLLLESWRTWMFLRHLEMVLEGLKYTKEYFLQVWWWLVEKKPVKTPPVLQVSSWSLGGKGCSWDTWRWCQKGWNIPRGVCLKVLSVFEVCTSIRTHWNWPL